MNIPRCARSIAYGTALVISSAGCLEQRTNCALAELPETPRALVMAPHAGAAGADHAPARSLPDASERAYGRAAAARAAQRAELLDRPYELADERGLERLASFAALPQLGSPGRYVQQTSRDRGKTPEWLNPLSRNGNRDYNNFLCKSEDAQVSELQWNPIRYRYARCEESYARGVMLARFTGPGRHVRTWIGTLALMLGKKATEVLRVYVDDDPTPRLELPLWRVLDGSAGAAFAPPFGAGSAQRVAWYYPLAFERKLIMTLDQLGDNDAYFFHSDAVLGDVREAVGPERERSRLHQAAHEQLRALEHSAAELTPLAPPRALLLEPGESRVLTLRGPATIDELRVRIPAVAFGALADVRVHVRWDDAASDAIDVPLSDLLGAGEAAPAHSSLALHSYVANDTRVLALRLPMPFARTAQLRVHNTGAARTSLELGLFGRRELPAGPWGFMHVQRHETRGPTRALQHVAAEATGIGRLVGVCGYIQGHPDPELTLGRDPLNLLEGDVSARIDGAQALDGTGTEEYADDVFYFAEAPHANAFTQAWGVENDPLRSSGRASFCRWHVLGTELDFASSLSLSFELGGSENPALVEHLRTVAFLYLPRP